MKKKIRNGILILLLNFVVIFTIKAQQALTGSTSKQGASKVETNGNGFTVKVRISNSDYKMFLFYQDGDNSIMESNFTIEDGYKVYKGSFSGDGYSRPSFKVQSPYGTLKMDNGGVMMGPNISFLVRNGEQITIEGDVEKAYTATVQSDDKETQAYELFRSKDKIWEDQAWTNMREKFSTHSSTDRSASAESIAESRAKWAKEFIKTHPNTYAALVVFGGYVFGLSNAEAKVQYAAIPDTYKHTELGKFIQGKIDGGLAAAVGKPVIPFSLKGSNGMVVDIASMKGKVILIDFWGSWCAPCRATHPHLKQLYTMYKEQGFEMVGVAIEHGTKEAQEKAWRSAMEKDGITWRQVLNDPSVNDIPPLYGVSGYPTKILVDRNGIIRGRFVGEPAVGFDKMLTELLAETPKATGQVGSTSVQNPSDGYTIFSGKITNAPGDYIIFFSAGIRKEIKLDKNGCFSDTLKIDQGYYLFSDTKNVRNIYMEPGKKLYMECDANNYENTLTYKGPIASINTYLCQKLQLLIKKVGTQRDNLEKCKATYALGEDEFLKTLSDFKTSLGDIMQGLPDYFVEQEKMDSKYFIQGYIIDYESFHADITNNPNFKISDRFANEIEKIDLNDEKTYRASPEYMKLAQRNIYQKITEAYRKDTAQGIEKAGVNFITANITNSFLRDTALDPIVNQAIAKTSSKKKLDEVYRRCMSYFSDDSYKKRLTQTYYNKIKTFKGAPSPKFVNYEIAKGGTASLDDFKGKYVYLDIWATWCGPCKAEIPFLKTVEEAYHGKNIEFISISIDRDRDRDKWKQMIKDLELRGVQLRSENGFESKFIKAYSISSIPRFILLDKDGNIIADDAPRPSSPDLVALFKNLDIK